MPDTPHVGSPTTEADGSSEPRIAPLHAGNSLVRLQGHFEKSFESVLWASRYIVFVAVIASLAIAFGSIYTATIDTIGHLMKLGDYAKLARPQYLDPKLTDAERVEIRAAADAKHDEMRADENTHVVEAIDGYLLGIVMLIFAFGLYELFISRIDRAEKDEKSSRILLIRSLDDLKQRLAQVVLLILIVKFFESTLRVTFDSSRELLYLAVGIFLIAGALYITHKGNHAQ